jgi:death on curing protein
VPAFRFLEIDEVLFFHKNEMTHSDGSKEIRDMEALESAIAAPRATFGGTFLMDIFEMAATYVNSIAKNHPFLDGNKRTALISSLAFLYLNGYECSEEYDEELADKILDLVNNKISTTELADYFRSRCSAIH